MSNILLAAARKMPGPIKDHFQFLKHPLDPWMRRRLFRATQNRVVQGPFAGLSFQPGSYHDLPCLLGTYEQETHPIIARLVKDGYDDIVNIGAASGFYAAGMAKLCLQAQVHAFEIDSRLLPSICSNAQANSVADRVHISEECTVGDLARLLPTLGRTLVLSDVEGAEIELLDPARVPELRAATLFIETHDAMRPRCTQTLLERFESTHAVEIIVSSERTLADFPYPNMAKPRLLFQHAALQAMWEMRSGPQEWMLLTPKSSGRTL